MTPIPNQHQAPDKKPYKKPYQKPSLKVYGDVEALTASATQSNHGGNTGKGNRKTA
jgi:hypothetical protein